MIVQFLHDFNFSTKPIYKNLKGLLPSRPICVSHVFKLLAYANFMPGSSVVEHSTLNPKVEGLNPSTCTRREKNGKSIN